MQRLPPGRKAIHAEPGTWCSREGERASRRLAISVRRGVFAETATQIGGFDNKYLLFKRFLEV